MKTHIELQVDISDLNIEYEVIEYTDVSEFWGRIETTDIREVVIYRITYNDKEVLSYDEDDISEWILDHYNEPEE